MRKNILGKEQIFFKQEGHQAFTVSFALADVCLEDHFAYQITQIFTSAWETIVEIFEYVF